MASIEYNSDPMCTKYLKSYSIVVLTLAVSLLSSCAFREDDVEEERKENTKQVIEALQNQADKGELTKENVSYSFLPEEIGKYQLVLKWPSSIPKVKVQVDGFVKGILARSEGFGVTVESGSMSQVILTAMNDLGNEISMYSLAAKAPYDLIVDSDYYPKSTELKFARIRITDKGTIYTGSSDLLIETPVLQVDEKDYRPSRGLLWNAHISTYKNAQEAREVYAATPGQIVIKILEKATGRLLINSIGLDGKDGNKGSDAVDLEGGPRDGADAKFDIKFIPGGRGPDRNSPPQCKTKIIAPAGKGKDGIAGADGSDGVDGSDSPKFIVNILGDHEEFSVYLMSRPGRGGAGGQKGLSLPPGIGGLKKKIQDCQNIVDDGREASGTPAKDAVDGKPGANGKANGLESNLPQYKTQIETYLPESR